MRNLPELLRSAERRVNAHVWPNRAETIGADAHLASIPANRDTDTDLLLIEAADRIEQLETALREEHGGRNHEPECPLCVALQGSTVDGGAEHGG